jgi:hypothetical protein
LKFGTEFHEIESADASQAGAHPSLAVSKTVSNAGGFKSLGLALSEKQIPQIVDTVPNSKHGMERMEWLSVFAKQVLSQLSYTPTQPWNSNRFLRERPPAFITGAFAN